MNTMQRSRLSTLRDYLALIVRRKWLILFMFLGCLGVALLVSSVIPNVYVSESLILFQPGEVSTDFVKEISNGTADERLTAIQATILSRSNLLKIIKECEPELVSYRGMNDDKKVDRMRSLLEIEFLSEKERNTDAPITHVRIRYREQNPELAQKITARLASLFIQKENRTREDQVYGTTTFLNEQLAKVMARLTESGEKLKTIKERYRNELPSQLESNLRALDRLQQQKIANAAALDQQTALQLSLERQLSQTPPTLRADDGNPAARARNPLVDSYLKKQAEYKDLLARATDKHPDVIRLKSELESLRKSIPPEDFDVIGHPGQSQFKTKTEPNPLYQSLSAEMDKVKAEIESRKRERRIIEAQISENNERVENAPSAEQEIAAVQRVNSDLAKQADDLRMKLDQAKLAETLESRQKTAQFVIVDPANLPLDPAAPNRTSIRLSAVALSLALALLAGIVADFSKARIFTSVEVERFLNAPVLVEIPRITPAWQSPRLRRMRLKYIAIVLIGAGVYSFGLYQLYGHRSFLLRVLDPLIQNVGASNAQK